MTKSPSLEVISDNEAALRESASLREKRRKPRIHLFSEQFRIDQTGKLFSVEDLSTDGMAFRILDQSDLSMLPVASLISGTLNLKGEKFSIQIQVRHLRPHVVGCQF